MYRMLYRARLRKNFNEERMKYFERSKEKIKDYIDKEKIMTLSLSCSGEDIFLYYECIEEMTMPDRLFENAREFLKPWPGEESDRYFVPMMDIFHYNKPLSKEHWERKQKVDYRHVRVARLKPEMVSSYIFYHYQYQEESPGDGDKYGIIGIHENMLCFYLEHPTVKEASLYKGKLETNNTPEDWISLMLPHFILWEDAKEDQQIWRETEVILSIL